MCVCMMFCFVVWVFLFVCVKRCGYFVVWIDLLDIGIVLC